MYALIRKALRLSVNESVSGSGSLHSQKPCACPPIEKRIIRRVPIKFLINDCFYNITPNTAITSAFHVPCSLFYWIPLKIS
jgi:hypothetical protein